MPLQSILMQSISEPTTLAYDRYNTDLLKHGFDPSRYKSLGKTPIHVYITNYSDLVFNEKIRFGTMAETIEFLYENIYYSGVPDPFELKKLVLLLVMELMAIWI